MKKLFTILLSFGVMTSVFAQAQDRDKHEDSKKFDAKYGQYEKQDNKSSHDVARTNEHGYDNTYASNRERDAQLQRINNEYDNRMMSVKSNRRMHASEKSRQLKMLESERAAKIKKVNMDFSKSSDKHDDRYASAGSKK